MKVKCKLYAICTQFGERVSILAESRAHALRKFEQTYPHEKVVGVTLMRG
jgi:hypothetical protein